MKKRLLDRLSDISRIHHRAAFVDVEHHIKKHQGSDAFLQLAGKRYSCRAFSNRAVSAAKIQKILEAGRLAPTAKNLQPVHVWVVSGDEALARLRTIHPCYDAPIVFMIGYDPAKAWVRAVDGKNGGEIDAAIVGTHMMLAATDVDLDSVWIGSFDPARIRELFPETAPYEMALLLPVGHASAHSEVSSLHGERVPFGEFVSEL
ncbi:MAG: nitroreductase family protein [Bacteroidales bacterium]|nr:nitroreductase family protein [Bacteroidales bacterium]